MIQTRGKLSNQLFQFRGFVGVMAVASMVYDLDREVVIIE